jgi:hypothetical protein
MGKMKLCARLEMEIIRRLQSASSRKKMSVSDVIAVALDAWEREQDVAEKVGERLEFLEKNLLALVELNEKSDDKIDRHFSEALAEEKEMLKSLYILIEARLREYIAGGKP